MKVCWNLTNLCDENCFYCFRDLLERPRPLEDNIVIINKLKNLGVTRITYAGGEPLIYKPLPNLLAYSKSLGISNAIITNGKNLTVDNMDEYLRNVDKITFSVDSPNEYINTTTGRGIDHYKHIKELLPFIKEKYPNIIIEINTVATKDNLSELDYMFEALGSELSFYGLKKWKISRFCPLRGYARERKNIFNLSEEEFLDVEKNYSGLVAPFEISVRNTDSIEENLIISPKGSFKTATNNEEIVLVEDIISTPYVAIKKSLELGGYHV